MPAVSSSSIRSCWDVSAERRSAMTLLRDIPGAGGRVRHCGKAGRSAGGRAAEATRLSSSRSGAACWAGSAGGRGASSAKRCTWSDVGVRGLKASE